MKELWTIWELDCLIYVTMAVMNGHHYKKCVKTKNRHNRQSYNKKSADDPRLVEIENNRKWISQIQDIIKVRKEHKKLTNKQWNNFLKIKKKYKASKTSKLIEISDVLKQRIHILSFRIKRQRKSDIFRKENNEFNKSPSCWYKSKIEKSTDHDKEPLPLTEDIVTFWKSIWSSKSPVISDKWKLWEQDFSSNIHITKDPSEIPFVSFSLLKKTVKKMYPWKAAGWDQIFSFYWQKLSSIHSALQNAINMSFEDGSCNSWETLGRTILLSKPGKDLSKPESYRPITCLQIIYKIRSALISTKLNDHIHDNNLWPFEQQGTFNSRLQRSTNNRCNNIRRSAFV